MLVGSRDGRLRFYDRLGSNAKNLIPSLHGDEIKHIDLSQDGRLALATCESYLLLFSTFQNQKSSFSFQFKKANKPKPKVLKIHPEMLFKLGVNTPQFRKAKFDFVRDSREQLIVAFGNNLVAIWKLSDVFNHHFSTRLVSKMDERIIGGDF